MSVLLLVVGMTLALGGFSFAMSPDLPFAGPLWWVAVTGCLVGLCLQVAGVWALEQERAGTMTTRVQSGQLKKAFLAAYRDTGNIRLACATAGLKRRATVYEWQEHDEAFALEFKQAQVEAVEALEAEAYRRAVTGIEEPVVAAGRGVVGTVTKYSDTLLIFLMKGAAPEKYRDRLDLRHSGAPQTLADLVAAARDDARSDAG